MKWFGRPRKRFDPKSDIVAGFKEDFHRKWIAPRGGGYSAGPAPADGRIPHPPKNPASLSAQKVREGWSGGYIPRGSMLSTPRVGHYVTGDQPIVDVKCSCGTVFKTHYADESWIATMLNAAIAHGIDVERGRN